MPKIPKRSSLPNQAADIIINMIETGEFTDTLPGERELASRFQIGRDTLRLALEQLEKDEYITASQHGKRRQIIRKTSAKLSSKTKRIAFLSPKSLTDLPPWMLIEVDTLRGMLNKREFEFEVVNSGVFQLKNPDSRLKKLIDSDSFDLWILYQCPAPVQRWFEKNEIPTIVRGYTHEGIQLPSIDIDWKAAAFHAGGELLRSGHNNVGLLIPNTNLAGLLATETGLRQSIEVTKGGKVHKIVDKVNPNSVHRALELAFKLEDPPTAIVTTRSRHVLTVITWLAQHRIRIPHDLSIISLAYETWFDHLTPKISHYHSDPETLAKTVLRMIISIVENQTQHSEDKLIIPNYVKGSSVKNIVSQ